MGAQVTVTLGISGKNDFSGGIGPRSFTRTMTAQGLAPEMPLTIPANAVDEAITLPPMTEQRCIIVVTDNPVTYRLNSELIGLNKNIELNGMIILPATPIVTQIVFTGNGVTASNVYILPVGK